MAMEGQDQAGGFIIPGMRFDPEEEDLLRFYLTPKINGDPLPWDGIKEFDVYGKQGPWEIVHGSETSEVYVFAISKNKSANMKQRTCDFGTWKQQRNSPVKHQGQTIGYGSYLSFYPEKEINPGFLGGSWNMTEYCLKGHEQNEGFVVCKVSFKVWTAKERARRGLDAIPPAVSGASVTDAAPPRKRTKVACGSNNEGAGSDTDAARPRKKAKDAVCGSSSNNPEATTSACAPSYSSIAAAEAISLNHGSSSSTVEEQPPTYGFLCAPNQESNNVVQWEAPPASSYYEDSGYLNLESNDYNDIVMDDQYLSSSSIEQEVAAGFDPSLCYEDYSHLLDSNNGSDQYLSSSSIEQEVAAVFDPSLCHEDYSHLLDSNNGSDQYLSSSSIQQEVAAGFDPSLCYEDYSHLLDSNNDSDQYLGSSNTQQEVAAGFDPSLCYEDYSHLLDSNNGSDPYLYRNYDGVEQPEASSADPMQHQQQ